MENPDPHTARCPGMRPVTLRGMGFSVDVGLFLCDGGDDDTSWPIAERDRFLDEINAELRRLGEPEHREPRSLADIDPPLDPGTDPCLLGASMGSYSSHSRRIDRLDWLARYVAVRGSAPDTDPPYEAELHHLYDALPDRRQAFDHLLTACHMGAIILPRPVKTVSSEEPSSTPVAFVSADRLRAEAVALGFVLRYLGPGDTTAPTTDWTTGTSVDDRSFADLDARIAADDTRQSWAEEANLCDRMLLCANDVLRTGALAITS